MFFAVYVRVIDGYFYCFHAVRNIMKLHRVIYLDAETADTRDVHEETDKYLSRVNISRMHSYC